MSASRDPRWPVGPFDMVVFGGTGDLAHRKIMPALLRRDMDGQVPEGSRIWGLGRSHLQRSQYVGSIRKSCAEQIDAAFDDGAWQRFAARLEYLVFDAGRDADYVALCEALGENTGKVVVFYLATAPDLFGPICRRLGEHGLVDDHARVVVEKPLGHDLTSSRAINDEIGSVFTEAQIFRIDHYLGKEAVQNLLALRFANTLFEPIWRAGGIDHVQITVAETLGVEGRGDYYERSGAMRDMVQNHMMQLLCLVAMEPPASFEPDVVRDEKVKVLRALRPIEGNEAAHRTVRGQYRAGSIDGKPVPAYQDEIGSKEPSGTETFVAVKAEIANWRWAGVPFYLRTGKRLPARRSDIVIQMRDVPHDIFPDGHGDLSANRLVIRVQPDEAICLSLMTKVPGPGGMRLRPAPLNLSFAEEFHVRAPDAYERLLMDVVRGNSTLFMRRDEIEAAWSWVEPILDAWHGSGDKPRTYNAGTWGPSSAIALIERDGRTWSEETE